MSDSDLRNLLLDCRSALRRANRRFEEDPLRGKLDEVISELAKEEDEDEIAEPETRTAQQVAYAWQIAIRGVSMTHPDLYAKLSRRVTDMLDTDVLQDPPSEFLKLEAKLESANIAQQNITAELQELRRALAEAVPLMGPDAVGSETECAQRRIQMLIKAASQGKAIVKPVVDNPADMSLSREQMLTVSRGQRALSQWERSWCVAEALVMTDQTAEQLKKLADAELVNVVLGMTS